MDNVKLVRNLYDAFGRGDIPGVLGMFSPDIRWHQAESNPYRPSGEAWVGPDAIVDNLFKRLGAEWDGFRVHPRSFHGAGGSVIVEGRYTGTYKPTGKSDGRTGVPRLGRHGQQGDQVPAVHRHREAPRSHGSEIGKSP